MSKKDGKMKGPKSRPVTDKARKKARARSAWTADEGHLRDNSSFGRAFSRARTVGRDEFTFGGQRYHTRTKEDQARTRKVKAQGRSLKKKK